MKIATDIEVIGLDIQTTGGTAFLSREFADKLATHPKIVEAYSEARHERLGNGWTFYIAEQDGSVTVSGDDAMAYGPYTGKGCFSFRDEEIEAEEFFSRIDAPDPTEADRPKPSTPRERLRALKAHPRSARGRR